MQSARLYVWEGISVVCLLKKRGIENIKCWPAGVQPHEPKDLVTPIGKNHMHAKAFCTRTVVYLF